MAYYAPTTARSRARPGVSLVLLVYLVVGAIVAATHDYWSNLHNLKQIGSALLATVAWPLILIGIDLHIH
jgi:protein-S-isoprenylcysteine O-methyltransferase Ste14